jgi:uncharacterized protein
MKLSFKFARITFSYGEERDDAMQEQMYIKRQIEGEIISALERSPVTALIGPRQAGKSTLAGAIMQKSGDAVYLDLERPSDLQKLQDAEWFLTSQKEKLICIDEIQRKPELFPVIRSLTDEWQQPGKFLILGSASRDLLRQSSESLAGRISYKKLTPFLWSEISDKTTIESYILRGGFPRSLLAANDEDSLAWREDFITTFLERDLLQWQGFTPTTMRRLWQMIAHMNGQIVNYSMLGNSLGVSNVTVKNYIDLLEATFMLTVVAPYRSNTKKRLVKSPRIYISDQGINNALLHLENFGELYGHPVIGSAWEQVVLSNLKGHFPAAEYNFYRSAGGAEIDFVMKHKNRTFAIECKSSQSPKPSKGFYSAIEDIQPDHAYIVAPVKEGWPLNRTTDVVNLTEVTGAIH